MASEEEMKVCFELFDRQNSGKITAADAASALRTLGAAPSEEEATELLGTGSVDFAAFQAAFGKCQTPGLDEVMEAFSTFDQNQNGYIPLKELIHLMKELGEGLDEKTLEEMKLAAEPDEEGQVNYRHFVEVMMNTA